MGTTTSMFPQLPSFTALISDTALYSNGIFTTVLPYVIAAVGIGLSVLAVKWMGRKISGVGKSVLGRRGGRRGRRR